VIGLRRGVIAYARVPLNEALKLGDTLLLIGPWADIERLRSNGRDLVIIEIPAEIHEVPPAPDEAPQALFCLALVVGLMVSGLIPNVQAALIGCLLMGLFGCIDLASAYRSIDWKTIVLIVGMLPFSVALHGLHDPGLIAGKHAGGHPGELHVRGLCARRPAAFADRADRLRHPGAVAIAAVTPKPAAPGRLDEGGAQS